MIEHHNNLSPWDQVLLARHPRRPYTLDYIGLICDDFMELHGDRRSGDDAAIVAGVARLSDQWVVVVGHQKGRDIQERRFRNFGSACPEGYRKALRIMRLAERCKRPILCMVDTPGADVSILSEERGIAEAIATTMHDVFLLSVPIIVVVIGEGGSGGALGIAVGDRVLMLEHSIYSVIAPEGCTAILGYDPSRTPEVAAALHLTANDALRLGVVDEVVPEPPGGAHRNYAASAAALEQAIRRHLGEVQGRSPEQLIHERRQRFRHLGAFGEEALRRQGAPMPEGYEQQL